MSPQEVRRLEERNQEKYGNPLGPTADQLHAKYGSWRAVSDAATRTSEAVDGELGLAYRPCPCDAEPRSDAEVAPRMGQTPRTGQAPRTGQTARTGGAPPQAAGAVG